MTKKTPKERFEEKRARNFVEQPGDNDTLGWIERNKVKVSCRTYDDPHDHEIDHGPLERKVTRKEKQEIHKVLRLYSETPLPRCKHRDMAKARKLDKELGHTIEEIETRNKGTHTHRNHICDECRCSHVAGYQTRGWWYWPPNNPHGYGEVGHLGVGPCFKHSPLGGARFNTAKYLEVVMDEIESIQQHSLAPDTQGGYMINMRKKEQEASERIEARTALRAIVELANDTVTRLKQHESDPMGREFHERLGAMFGYDPEELGPEEQQELQEIFGLCPLTELSRGVHVPMASKTSIELQARLIKDMGTMSKQVHDMHTDETLDRDKVRMAVGKLISAVEQIYGPKGDKTDWQDYLEEVKEAGRMLDSK